MYSFWGDLRFEGKVPLTGLNKTLLVCYLIMCAACGAIHFIIRLAVETAKPVVNPCQSRLQPAASRKYNDLGLAVSTAKSGANVSNQLIRP
jgi:hypothetical protein